MDGAFHGPEFYIKLDIPAHTNAKCKKYRNENGCDLIIKNVLCAGNPHNRTASHSGNDSGVRLYKKLGMFM